MRRSWAGVVTHGLRLCVGCTAKLHSTEERGGVSRAH